MQIDACDGEYVDGEQDEQFDDPEVAWYAPGEQLEHETAAAEE